jgi:PAS domain S-box-containing protein
MPRHINVLIVEDSQSDTYLLLRELRRSDFVVHHRRVDKATELEAALNEQKWDIILSDYYLPGFDALAALQIVQERALDIPVILISGLVTEENAIAALKAGARDFFAKDKLALLAPAVERELHEAGVRHKRREAETLFTRAFHASPVGTVISRVSDGLAIDVNARFLEVFGFTREEIIGKRSSELGIWANPARREGYLEQLRQAGSLRDAEMEVNKNGGILGHALVSVEKVSLNDEDCLLTMVHDISERKATEQALQRYTKRLELLHEIDRSILRADQPETIAHSVLTRLRSLMEYHSASVITYDANYSHFTVQVTVPPVIPFLTPGRTYPVENKAMIESLHQDGIYLVHDLATVDPISTTEKVLFDAGLRSYARIALIAKGNMLGSMNFHSEEVNAFSLSQLDIAREASAQMAIAIQNAQLYQQVQNHAQELEQRVLERTLELQASEKSLRAALAQEKELNELKTRFVSMVSHDFRTPLTIIQSNTNLLQASQSTLDEGKKARYYSRIYSQIQRMVELLDDVISFSRADTATSTTNFVATDLDQFCQAIVDEMQSTGNLSHTLIYSSSQGPANILVDEKLLQQALINLLTNAFKYSPAESNVYLDLSFTRENALIRVQDEGIGIPKADQPHLFQMFHRAVNVGTITGTGLGLAIVKRAVEAHQGKIEVESEEGVGTTFTVKLPLARNA